MDLFLVQIARGAARPGFYLLFLSGDVSDVSRQCICTIKLFTLLWIS